MLAHAFLSIDSLNPETRRGIVPVRETTLSESKLSRQDHSAVVEAAG